MLCLCFQIAFSSLIIKKYLSKVNVILKKEQNISQHVFVSLHAKLTISLSLPSYIPCLVVLQIIVYSFTYIILLIITENENFSKIISNILSALIFF